MFKDHLGLKINLNIFNSHDAYRQVSLFKCCSYLDETFLIVNVGDEGIVTIVAHQSRREVIPCKPTSPKVELTLFDPSGMEVNDSKFSLVMSNTL